MRSKTLFVSLLAATLLGLPLFLGTIAPTAQAQNSITVVEETEIWNERYSSKGFIFGTKPVKFLKENIELLPLGRAFVVAMGEGRNAVFLAQKGFLVEGCDFSSVAVEKSKKLAKKKKVEIDAFVADLADYKLKKNRYDLITCFYYLQRDLIPQIKDALRIGGRIIFETYSIDQLTLGPDARGPKNKDYLLKHNELLDFFRDFRVVLYEETVIDGKKAVARLIAEKVKK